MLEYIEDRVRELGSIERVEQIVFVQVAAAGKIDDRCALRQIAEKRGVQNAFRLICERQEIDQDVCSFD